MVVHFQVSELPVCQSICTAGRRTHYSELFLFNSLSPNLPNSNLPIFYLSFRNPQSAFDLSPHPPISLSPHLLLSVQHLPQFPCQRVRGEGFLYEVHSFIQHAMVHNGIIRITRDKENLDIRH